MNWYGIWMLKVLGLAKKIKVEPVVPIRSRDFDRPQSRQTRGITRDSQSAGAD
jgi:hypothetical protein